MHPRDASDLMKLLLPADAGQGDGAAAAGVGQGRRRRQEGQRLLDDSFLRFYSLAQHQLYLVLQCAVMNLRSGKQNSFRFVSYYHALL
jgi:hypothetical protein